MCRPRVGPSCAEVAFADERWNVSRGERESAVQGFPLGFCGTERAMRQREPKPGVRGSRAARCGIKEERTRRQRIAALQRLESRLRR